VDHHVGLESRREGRHAGNARELRRRVLDGGAGTDLDLRLPAGIGELRAPDDRVVVQREHAHHRGDAHGDAEDREQRARELARQVPPGEQQSDAHQMERAERA
jgi:hypothetical protein